MFYFAMKVQNKKKLQGWISNQKFLRGINRKWHFIGGKNTINPIEQKYIWLNKLMQITTTRNKHYVRLNQLNANYNNINSTITMKITKFLSMFFNASFFFDNALIIFLCLWSTSSLYHLKNCFFFSESNDHIHGISTQGSSQSSIN